ncbi:phage tail tape measure protein [Hyphomicrobium sp. LHD-15]|uniref:phage tail tape measure protein n=1 Tax=Hyphomicrobium sp. LHD-15 TaxID=3072142 RepID=UPI00280D6452|nr:phage tail tape measure protein [Hyphomicrobium sp. LHD-15]MDQ8700218.1 phage tail tape measure protein [Hyphomicrobium sp. LHD-15]
MGRTLSGPTTLGLGATIYATQEFERRLLGVQLAAMSAMDDLGNLRQVNDVKLLQRDAEQLKRSVMSLSEQLGFSPTGLMQAAEAAAKLGVSLKQAESVARNAAIWNMAEQEYAPAEAAEFLGKLAAMFNAPEDPQAYNEWVKATADKIATVAAAAPTDISSFSEGLRQFAGAFALSGGTIDQANALLGTATKFGQDDIETGTALKMGLVRLISPTLPHSSALSAAGIDRSKYLDITAADPRRSVNQLVQLFPGYIDKALKQSLFQKLTEAFKSGRGADPGFIGEIAGILNKATGAKESIDDTHMKVLNAIVTSGGKVDYYGYLRDIAELQKEGKFSDAAFIEAFTKHHYSKMSALLGHSEWMDRYLGLSQSATGRGQDTRVQAYKESAAGRWEESVSSLSRALIKLRETDGVNNLISVFGRLADGIASLPPSVVEVLGGLAAGLLALGAAGWAVGGIAALAGVLPTLATGLTLLAGTPLGLAALGVGAAGYLGYQAYENWDEIEAKMREWKDHIASFFSDPFSNLTPAPVGPNVPPAPVDRFDFGQRGLIRDIEPLAGPQTIDVTGRVQADVQGTVAGKMELEVTVKGNGEVTKQTGGDLKGNLNTGKSMPDAGR